MSLPFRSGRGDRGRFVSGVVLALSLMFVHAESAEAVLVFAAASLKNAMDEIAAVYREETGETATVVYAASSLLARQIQHGAPADIFVSANPGWMDILDEAGLIVRETRFDLLGNSLVLVSLDGDRPAIELRPGISLDGLLGDGYLAIPLVDAVPAGIYGKAALQSIGAWDGLAARTAQTDNVRAALALVSGGEVPLGIVYASDVLADERVTVIGRFAAGSHPPIIYPAAAVTGGDGPVNRRFLAFLRGPDASEAFRRHGFIVPAD